MKLASLAAAALATVLAATTSSAFTTTETLVPTAQGDMRVTNWRPEVPLANLIVLSGGPGFVNFPNGPEGALQQFVDRGSSVYIVDVPAVLRSQGGWTRPYRASAEHRAELLAALQHAQQRDPLPTWLLGWSNGAISAANLGIATPRSTPFGIIMESPALGNSDGVLTLNLEALQRPILVLVHESDLCPGGAVPALVDTLMSRVSATPQRRLHVFTGGNPNRGDPCGADVPHGLGGLDIPFAQEVTEWERLKASYVQEANYQGMWWRSPAHREEGWGLNITHQGDKLFATWFTYAADGSDTWFSSDLAKTAPGAYSGSVYRTTGAPFNRPWSAPPSPAQTVGSMTLTFTDSLNGIASYVVNGVAQSKPITQYQFADPLPACIRGVTHLSSPNYQAIWWNEPAESQPGWGVNVTHQGDTLFATWFTYGPDSSPAWFVMSNGVKIRDGVYTGDVHRTRGPAFNSPTWNNLQFTSMPAGSATFTFTGAERGTFTSTVDGLAQTKPIIRYVFGNPVTVCR